MLSRQNEHDFFFKHTNAAINISIDIRCTGDLAEFKRGLNNFPKTE